MWPWMRPRIVALHVASESGLELSCSRLTFSLWFRADHPIDIFDMLTIDLNRDGSLYSKKLEVSNATNTTTPQSSGAIYLFRLGEYSFRWCYSLLRFIFENSYDSDCVSLF